MQIMFSSLSALDNGVAGQNVRLLITEKLGVMETYLSGPPSCRPGVRTFPCCFTATLTAALQANLRYQNWLHLVFLLFSQKLLSMDVGSPSPTGTFVFYLFIYKASSVVGTQEMGGEWGMNECSFDAMACKVPGLCEARTTQRPEHENLLWTSGKIHIWALTAVVDCFSQAERLLCWWALAQGCFKNNDQCAALTICAV